MEGVVVALEVYVVCIQCRSHSSFCDIFGISTIVNIIRKAHCTRMFAFLQLRASVLLAV